MIHSLSVDRRHSSFDGFESHGDTRPSLHIHDEVELTYVISGYGVRAAGNSLTVFGPGELALVPAGLSHGWVASPGAGDFKAFVVQFPANLFSSFPECDPLQEMFSGDRGGIFISRVPENLGRTVEQAVKETGISSLFKLMASLFFMQALDSEPLYRGNQREPGPIGRVMDITGSMFTDLGSGIGLEEVSRESHMSPPAFSRWFHREFGRTFLDYMNDYRIKHAICLLQNTDLSIATIARNCGFGHDSTFNRLFRKYTNSVPRSFRNS